jgi:UDP-N-acetylglucosamine 2-epimerase
MNDVSRARVVIFGSTGMLGRTVLEHFQRRNPSGPPVMGVARKDLDVRHATPQSLMSLLAGNEGKEGCAVINCVGVIPQKVSRSSSEQGVNDYWTVNAVFPIMLAEACTRMGSALYHISTDCVFSGKRSGPHATEDECDATSQYGMSKRMGEYCDASVIRTSIVGEEGDTAGAAGFLEWVRVSSGSVDGYLDHLWNGVTCLHLAEVLGRLIESRTTWKGVRQLASSEVVSKCELLHMIKDVYGLRALGVESIVTGDPVDRSLTHSDWSADLVLPPVDLRTSLEIQKVFWRSLQDGPRTGAAAPPPPPSRGCVMTVSGIRPDFIRMSAIFKELDGRFNHVLVHTGQHYDDLLSGVFFKELDIRDPDYVLCAGRNGGTHYDQLSYLSVALPKLMAEENLQPDLILFLGDSNTVCVSLPLRKAGYRIGHVEAGMRSGDGRMLEEINRTVCDHCSDLHMVYHVDYLENLRRENITTNVRVVGNTIVEVCRPLVPAGTKERRLILLDIHRPENFAYAGRMRAILSYAIGCARRYGVPVQMLKFHGTCKALDASYHELGPVQLVDLLPYKAYLSAVYHSVFLISDSGTAQEEAALLGTPVVVPRDYTERPQSMANECSFMLKVGDRASEEASHAWLADIAAGHRVMRTEWLGSGATAREVAGAVGEYLEGMRSGRDKR